MSRIFAIGDIHGCCKTFKKLLLEEIHLTATDEVYCLGDYVDRGKDSKGVIDLILELRHQGYNIHTLRGNHEELMLKAREGYEEHLHWLRNGGDAALKSFGISHIDELPARYLKFIEETEYFISTDKYVFVHAGLNFTLNNPFLDRHAMLWTRDTYFDKEKINNRIVVHGHSQISLEEVLNPVNPYNINIDAGCVYADRPGRGNLVALELTTMNFIVVRNIDG